MKIAFISIRGIPNIYGGFEEFAEHIAVGLTEQGNEITVYSPKYHPYKENTYKGVRIKHIYSPETWMGSSLGSFFYDFMSIKDALKNEKYDIIYVAGYVTSIPAYIWYNIRKRKQPIFITNMDGLEFKRTKFNSLVQKLILKIERIAVKQSHYIIADNMGIQDYYKQKYNKESKFLAYGADIPEEYDVNTLKEYNLISENYFLQIARLEPENNIEMTIMGYIKSNQYCIIPLVIIGNTNTKHGKYLYNKYSSDKNIKFLGGIYDTKKVNALRHFSLVYFHGHSVGGTNPSLLEAMACGCFIFSHDNPFNKSVLNGNAIYYDNINSVSTALNNIKRLLDKKSTFIKNNIELIKTKYSWKVLVVQHKEFFKEIMKKDNL